MALCALIHAADFYFEKRGEQYQWSFDNTSKLKTLFIDLMNTLLSTDSQLAGRPIPVDELKRIAAERLTPRLRAFSTAYARLTMGRQPYPDLCSLICADDTCLYRFVNRELLKKQVMIDRFGKALTNRTQGQSFEEAALEESRSATSGVISRQVDLGRRNKAALCYALQFAHEMWPYESHERRGSWRGS